MKYAIIVDGVVANHALASEPLDENWIPAGDSRIGDLWDGVAFHAPVAVVENLVPPEVPMWAARRVLIAAGLMQPILDALAAMPGIEGEIARSDFEYAPNIVRASPFIAYAQGLLGMTDAQIDELFIQAKAVADHVA